MKNYLALFIFIIFANPVALFADDTTRSIHVFVALCDNIHQGIVPVPDSLGNGKDPRQNLYWGALYGVKTFFNRSPEWKLLKTIKQPNENVLERCIFQKIGSNIYLIADAYDGEKIESTITDLIESSAGAQQDTININDLSIGAYGNSNLLAYVGHNGLMDFTLPSIKLEKSSKGKDIIVLACKSRSYFEPLIQKTGANPLLLTKGLMAPEAYTLKAAIDGWALFENNEQIRLRAVKAYQKYQKIRFHGANSIFYTYFE